MLTEQYDPVTAMSNKLGATFRAATKGIPFNHPMLKRLQVHFMYFVDDVQRGPVYDRPKLGFFVLKWIQRIEETLNKYSTDSEIDAEFEKLLNTQYVHNNFY